MKIKTKLLFISIAFIIITLLGMVGTSFAQEQTITDGEIEKQVRIPTRREFISAVDEFKHKYNINLQELFSFTIYSQNSHKIINKKTMGKEKIMALQKEFFSIPEIRDYLERDSSVINFKENYPDLSSSRLSYFFDDDSYELSIYKDLGDHIPYRSTLTTSNNTPDVFYTMGASHEIFWIGVNKIAASMQRGKICLSDECKYKDYETHVEFIGNIYNIRHLVNEYTYRSYLPKAQWDEVSTGRSFEKATSKVLFLLFSIAKDDHASSIIIIFDNVKKRVLASIFINSWNKKSYYDYIEERWNYPGYYRYSIMDPEI